MGWPETIERVDMCMSRASRMGTYYRFCTFEHVHASMTLTGAFRLLLNQLTSSMASVDWEAVLNGHPIFTPNEALDSSTTSKNNDLSNGALNAFDDEGVSRRRQIMCLKDSEFILAYKSEIRIATLIDAKVSGSSEKTYKVSRIST